MRVSTTDQPSSSTGADTTVYGITDAGDALDALPAGALALLERDEAKTKRGHLALLHDGDRRVLLVGLGDAASCDRAALHDVAATVVGRLRELGSDHACWVLPAGLGPALAVSALVEGTVLAAYRCTDYTSGVDEGPAGPSALTIAGAADDLAPVAARAATVASAVNRARDLQNGPPNVVTPTYLAERAEAIAASHDAVSCEVGDAERIADLGMGAFAAVTQGSDTPPALIVLRHEPAGLPADAPLLALVGKGVTFDSGGLSIKPASSMVTMKSDMSGAAAVLEATAAVAELGLPVRLLTIVGATENTINGHALKVGDVVTAANDLTIEIDNTDAEGRLVLADCLHRAVELGADRIVDVATLTGAMAVALGTAYVGYFASDEALAGDVAAAGAAGGERLWRMPLDRRYGELMKGTIADLTNAAIGKGGGACSAAAFLQRFVGDVPWAHFDIAGTAFNADEPFAKKGGTGAIVRTLIALADAES